MLSGSRKDLEVAQNENGERIKISSIAFLLPVVGFQPFSLPDTDRHKETLNRRWIENSFVLLPLTTLVYCYDPFQLVKIKDTHQVTRR